MTTVGQREHITQKRIVKLFQEALKYDYLGNWEKDRENHNIEELYLRAFLKKKRVHETLVNKALYELKKVAGDQNKSLYDINKEVYGLLRYGVKVKEELGENTKTVMLIDWENPLNNHFAIAEEVTVSGQHDKRPDIVLYINGIALGTLELKRSIVSVSEGIRQNLDNQKKEFIQPFFTTVQFIMAGNDTQGLRYGTIETKEKYYLTWKETVDADNHPSQTQETQDVTSSVNETQDVTSSVNETQDVASSANETQDVTSSVNETQDVTSSVNETQDVTSSVNETQDVASSANETQDVTSSVNETQDVTSSVNETQDVTSSVNETQDVASLPSLDRALIQLCKKERLLELIHDFIVFDAGTKKLCRHNQYFGVKAAQERVRKREGGIIWHTQGSGKSIIMVWLAKWIRENVKGSRVLIITDRIELDQQIEGTFFGVGEEIHRTKSGQDLIKRLNETKPWLIASLIHKFTGKEEGDIAGYIEDLQKYLPKNFKAKGDIYIFVDECHRTQSGDLHKAMKSILPNAMFIGFTGTPLLKADKQSSIEVFGSYIHTYKYDEAVKDGVVLDLRYEARDIDQNLTSQIKIDLWFESKTSGLNDIARAQLKKRWGTMQAVLSSQDRLNKIVADILLDMETRDRLKSGHGNALLVSGSIYQACKFYELFVSQGFTKCAIITSYKPSIADIKGEDSGEGETEQLRQYEIYNKMLNKRDVEIFEKEAKKKFVEEPGQMKLLIVVDKLLTGFDAPPATYLYIDKQMRDHGLFQAICRVNRLDGEDKEYGYIIDYKDLFQSLEGAVHDYTSGAFDGYDKQDVNGLLTNRLDKAKEQLEEARETIKTLCEAVAPPKGTLEYQHYFCGSNTTDKEQLKNNEPKRIALYKLTVSLIRAYANLANEIRDAGYSENEIKTIQHEVDYFEKVRTEVKFSSGDYIDLKLYEPAMRHLLDTYIQAEESRKISVFDELTLIQLIVERGVEAVKEMPAGIARDKTAVSETIENNLRKVIIDEQPINPRYYERMSELLDSLIQERKAQAFVYEKYLQKLVDLTKQVANPGGGTTYPKALNTNARRALFDNLGQNEELAIALDKAIIAERQDEFRGNIFKERAVKNVIREMIAKYNVKMDDSEIEHIFGIVKNQKEY